MRDLEPGQRVAMKLMPQTAIDWPASSPLGAILGRARLYSAEFPVDLANHAPMALTILDRLGAPEARLLAYVSAYGEANALVAVPARLSPIVRERWTESLGDRTREGDYRDFFACEVATLGIRGAVARYLPALLPGIAASALHAFMRLAYGLLRHDPDEVGTALGYWAACFLPMPPATGAPPLTDDPGEVLARVAAVSGLRALPRSELLWHGMRAAGREADFAPVVDWLRIGPDSLSRCAATSLALFAATRDFAALHALTGCHWVRIVSGFCPDPMLLRYFWQAVAALVPAIGFPDLPSRAALQAWREQPCPDWAAITAAVIHSDDEHDISLVFSAREEQRVYGDRLYRVVAARRIGLIP